MAAPDRHRRRPALPMPRSRLQPRQGSIRRPYTVVCPQGFPMDERGAALRWRESGLCEAREAGCCSIATKTTFLPSLWFVLVILLPLSEYTTARQRPDGRNSSKSKTVASPTNGKAIHRESQVMYSLPGSEPGRTTKA